MGSRIQCFWIEPADVAVESYRRYHPGDCSVNPMGYHTSYVEIGHIPWPVLTIEEKTGRRSGGEFLIPDDEKKRDPRWPKACVCGYVYLDEDRWQWGKVQLYKDAGGTLYELREAPVGAMWDAWWYEEKHMGADGLHLTVKTPGGEWLVDGPASGKKGRGWQRTGTVPNITATPSIICGGYHGWLRNGILEEC